MMHSRFVGSFVSIVLGSALAIACSSAPEDDTAQVSEAFKICPSWGCGPYVPLCASMPTCSAKPISWTDVLPPFFGIGPKYTDAEFALKAKMIAIGCTSPAMYDPCTPGPGCLGPVRAPVSICPSGVSADVDALAKPWCDDCTGHPALGYEVVTWKTGPENPAGCTGALCEPALPPP